MNQNDFKITVKKDRKGFSKRLILLLLVCLFVLLPFTLRSFFYLLAGISYGWWNNLGFSNYIKDLVIELTFIILFVVLLVILCTQKPFSKMLLRCSLGLGILYIFSAVIIPRLPDFKVNTFILLGINDVVIFEGWFFIIGLVLVLFSVLMKEGLEYQTQLNDEIL